MRGDFRRLVAMAAFVVALAGCGPREDVTPQIEVQPGAAARAMALTGKMTSGAAPAAPSDAGADEPPEGRVVFTCMEPHGALEALVRVPCDATFARRGTPAPATAADGGVEDADDDDGDGDEVLAADGKVAMKLAPGKYHVVAARGLEHASAAFDVDVVAGQTTWGPHEGAVTIARVVDTRGYFAADLAVRPFEGDATEASAQAGEWLATEAARGIEVVAPGPAATSFDLGPLVHEKKLDGAIVVLTPRDLGVLDLGSLEPGGRDAAIADYLARLAAKSPVTPVASGEARTYVRVDDDEGTTKWDATRDADFVRGVHDLRDVVLTEGPFLRVTANGAGIGGVAKPKAGVVDVVVQVEAVAGTKVTHVALRHARAKDDVSDAKDATLAVLPSGAVGADVTFHVRASKDDAFVVTAEGEGEGTFAVTGAVWIDANGDGESLGRKLSDIPPPPAPLPASDGSKTKRNGKDNVKANARKATKGTP